MIDFAPIQDDAKRFLTDRTGIDFSGDFDPASWLFVTSRDAAGVDGVLVAEFVNPYDAHITIAVDDPRLINRRLLRAVFTTLFAQAVRVTVMTRPENQDAIRLIEKLGFQYEGFCRMGIEGKWDALVFGMLRHECRWFGAPGKLAKAA